MTRVALTGATGYVGSIIEDALPDVVRLTRRPTRPSDIAWSLAGAAEELPRAVIAAGVTVLVHAAWDMTSSSRDEIRRVCVQGSLALLAAARQAKMERLVFISTISAFDDARSVYGQAKREVERAVLADGGIVFRLGLVHGGGDGGMFGRIRRSVRGARVVPMIGAGLTPQYLLPATRLQAAIRRAIAGDLDGIGAPITLADEDPIAFRDLVRRIAAEEQSNPRPLPVPWRLLHAGLAGMEMLGLTPPMRSDSVISFVHQDPKPDFAIMRQRNL